MKNLTSLLNVVALAFIFVLGIQIANLEKVRAQDSCKPVYPAGFTAKDVGRDPKTSESHCYENCIKQMHIGPAPVAANINQEIQVTFWVDKAIGGPNARCASSGKVNWGDGSEDNMPSESWNGCGVAAGKIAGGDAPKVTMKHTYHTAGRFCLSATMWGNHKYHGDGSCSYDCTVSADTIVAVKDVPPLGKK